MKNPGQTLKIFLVDGVAEGLKTIEKSNWIGKCLACTRTQFPKVKNRSEFTKPGVYLIYGMDISDLQPTIYIGEGDPVIQRLEAHDRNKDFWDHLILFTSKDENLNKAHIQYLESRLFEMAKTAKRCILENGNSPNLPALSESDVADMETFLENMVLIYGVLGISVFETPRVDSDNSKPSDSLILKGQNVDAIGYVAIEGFIVAKGSKATTIEVPSIPPAIRTARAQMVKDGLFTKDENSFVLTQDYTFTSPSKAGCIFLGRSCNGRVEWKNGDGKTLKEIQETK